jgi:hypothetical protein
MPRGVPQLVRAAGRRLRGRRPAGSDRDRLSALLPRHGVVAEIGVWEGAFSRELLDRLEPVQLHLVDPWAFVPQYDESWYGGGVAQSQDDMDNIFRGVRDRFAKEIAGGRVVLHRTTSLNAAASIGAERFDVVYIDGDHTYDAVRADLQAWAPLLNPDGVLAGDDYDDGGWWQGGVKRAVDEFAELSTWRLTIIGRQFMFRRV